MKLQEYLVKHKIIEIGVPLPGYICTETIVDDPKEFITIVQQNNYYVSEIRWWEHVAISEKPKIGYGGSRDPRNPTQYYFAETDICICFQKPVPYQDYVSSLDQIKNMYPDLILYPAFDIKRCI